MLSPSPLLSPHSPAVCPQCTRKFRRREKRKRERGEVGGMTVFPALLEGEGEGREEIKAEAVSREKGLYGKIGLRLERVWREVYAKTGVYQY